MSYQASAPPELDSASADAILAAYGKYLDDCESVEVIRGPIIRRLATAKEERGDFETVPSPRAADPSLSAKERGAASRQLAAKSKPNRPDQTVVKVGIGGTVRIIRVDADEDPYLTQAYSSLHDIERLFLESIMLVVPNSKLVRVAMKSILAVVPFLLTFFGPARTALDCEGCSNDDSNWEGTGGNDHIWVYDPGQNDTPGYCEPGSCQWKPCEFHGTITFRNASATAVDLHYPGQPLVVVTVPAGGTHTTPILDLRGDCGQLDEVDPWFGAHPVGGGARISGYIFSCGLCSE